MVDEKGELPLRGTVFLTGNFVTFDLFAPRSTVLVVIIKITLDVLRIEAPEQTTTMQPSSEVPDSILWNVSTTQLVAFSYSNGAHRVRVHVGPSPSWTKRRPGRLKNRRKC